MTFDVEVVNGDNLSEMLTFLRKHTDYTLFLLGNLENYGISLSEHSYSGNFKLIRRQKDVVAVFCLTRSGNLLIQSEVEDQSIFEAVIAACKQEDIIIKGLIGDWDFCRLFWQYLKSKKIVSQETYVSKEILYSLNLEKAIFCQRQFETRLLTETDFGNWKPLRLSDHIESGIPNNLNEEEFFELFLEKTKRKISWGLFWNHQLVSIADLNAKASDLGQVGGVYTAPNFRRKGFSRAVMEQLICDAKHLHHIRKLIIFTDEKNFPAQKLYLSLGAKQIGYFSLFFSE